MFDSKKIFLIACTLYFVLFLKICIRLPWKFAIVMVPSPWESESHYLPRFVEVGAFKHIASTL